MKREQRKRDERRALRLASSEVRRAEVEAAGAIMKADQLIKDMSTEILRLREMVERQRGMLFGAFLGRALGEEPRLSDAMLQAFPEFFAGEPEAPWMVFRQ